MWETCGNHPGLISCQHSFVLPTYDPKPYLRIVSIVLLIIRFLLRVKDLAFLTSNTDSAQSVAPSGGPQISGSEALV